MPSVRATSTNTSGSTAVTGITIAPPAGTQQGDLLFAVLVDANDGPADPADMSITGGGTWKQAAVQAWGALDTGGWRLMYRLASGSEPANYSVATLSSVWISAAILAIQNGADAVPTVGRTLGQSSTVNTPSQTPSGANDLDIRIAATPNPENSTWSVPAGYTTHATIRASASRASVAVVSKPTPASNPSTVQTFTKASSFITDGVTVLIPPYFPRFIGWSLRL